MKVHETHEKIHETGHHGHESSHGGHSSSTKIAILISVLACLLAMIEMGVKSSQNSYQALNVQVSDTWAFFQAKAIRLTTLQAFGDMAELMGSGVGTPEQQAQFQKKSQEWRAQAAHYDSDEAAGDGRKQLAEKAHHLEEQRDHALATYHILEYATAALEIAIVVASAAVVTDVMALAFGAGVLGAFGVLLAAVGQFAPSLLHHG